MNCLPGRVMRIGWMNGMTLLRKGLVSSTGTVVAQISVDRISLPPLAISLSEYVYNQTKYISDY